MQHRARRRKAHEKKLHPQFDGKDTTFFSNVQIIVPKKCIFCYKMHFFYFFLHFFTKKFADTQIV